MRRWIGVAAALMLAAGVAVAQEPRNSGIEGTIGRQIEAFQADDFATAFGFASPGIRGQFVTPEAFGRMVREGYPMVWRPGSVRYLELREIGGTLWQKVLIQDQAGRFHALDYQMIPDGDGWLINGVQVLGAPEVGA